ncbi:xylose isomerase, partial [Kouleothrix aurantiaca]
PALLGLVFDTGHYVYGSGANDGAGIGAALDRYGDRIWYMHYKDCEPAVAARARAEGWDYFTAVGRGVFCELGRGCVDFAAATEWLRARDYSGFVTVEQDVLPGMGEPRASAQRNRDYLATLGL